MTAFTIKLNNGYSIPVLGLGTYLAKGFEEIIQKSIDMGYRLFDTAFVYQNEKQFGQALESKLKTGSVKREELFIVSKLWNIHHKPENVIPAIKRSLSDLRLDYLDLYLIHWPMAFEETTENEYAFVSHEDSTLSIEDTWRAMEECVKQGYAKMIGISNFNSIQVEKICKIATIKPVINQVECNPYKNQKKLIDYCRKKEIIIMGYSPLYAPNVQTAKTHGLNLFEEPIIKELSKKYSKTPAQIVLRFLIELGTVPIPKSANVERLQENLNVFDFTLEANDVEKIETLNKDLRCVEYLDLKDFKEYPFAIEF